MVGEGPTSIQLVAGLVGEERVFYKYPTGCWLGVCVGRGVACQYPSVCCFGGWEGGISKVSNWFLVGWGGWNLNNIQMFFGWVERE